jgi:glycosyltransferase involved in cell wall biosynthesis
MKILLCHNYYQNPGGESEVFEAEVQGLKSMGDVPVIYDRKNTEIEQLPAREKVGLFFSAYYSHRTVNELQHIIQRERPSAAIVQNVFPLLTPSIYLALKAANIPTIQAVYNYRLVCPSAELFTQGQICERCVPGNTIHAVLHKCYRESYIESAWYASIIGFHRYAGTFSDSITSFMVPDHFLGSKLIAGGIPAHKIWRNPNPFFVNAHQPHPRHEGYVLYVGRLVRQKGILTLLNAMKHCGHAAHLVIIGRGELADTVQESILSSGMADRIHFAGPLWGDEVTQFIEKCAAVVIPSEWYDNLPMILCRANAMGKPIIASRINGIPEYVQEGMNGYLFEPGNEVELASLIELVLGLSPADYADLSNSSRKFADDFLDYPNHYANLMDHIRKITDGNSHS